MKVMISSLNAHNMLFCKDFLHILSLSKTKFEKKTLYVSCITASFLPLRLM